MTLDAEKLKRLIARLSRETTGFCTSTGVCIGTIDDKQIHLRVEADEDDFMNEVPKWRCVEETSEPAGRGGR